MRTKRVLLAVFASLTFCVAAAHAAPSAASAKTRATEAMDAMKSGDYTKFVEYSDPALVDQMGGAEKLADTTKEALASANVTITAVTVGDAGTPVTDGDITYVVVPTALTLDLPTATVVSKGYLLGISRSGGDWKFLDGSSLKPEILKALGLELPAELKLPEKVAPTVTNK